MIITPHGSCLIQSAAKRKAPRHFLPLKFLAPPPAPPPLGTFGPGFRSFRVTHKPRISIQEDTNE